jgi:ubiquinone biosynthesis protein
VQLDPSFQLASVLHPYAERLLVRQYAPMRLTRRLAQTSLDVAQLGIELPMRSRRILDDLDRGTIEIGVRPEHFDPLVRRLERLAHRLVLGILAAAFINGLAILLAAYHLPAWERWIEPLAAVGLALATALGGYLAFVILRAGHG